ncbi:MAG: J domain-containing protein [Clostridiales bacterium]|nr:J domain-containing protein [Clostridiales bacterium]
MPINKLYNPYTILGLNPNATMTEIKSAYRTLSQKYHPDLHMNDTEENIKKYEELQKEINLAYQHLSDPDSKKEIDTNLAQAAALKKDKENVTPREEYNAAKKIFITKGKEVEQLGNDALNYIYNNWGKDTSEIASNAIKQVKSFKNKYIEFFNNNREFIGNLQKVKENRVAPYSTLVERLELAQNFNQSWCKMSNEECLKGFIPTYRADYLDENSLPYRDLEQQILKQIDENSAKLLAESKNNINPSPERLDNFVNSSKNVIEGLNKATHKLIVNKLLHSLDDLQEASQEAKRRIQINEFLRNEPCLKDLPATTNTYHIEDKILKHLCDKTYAYLISFNQGVVESTDEDNNFVLSAERVLNFLKEYTSSVQNSILENTISSLKKYLNNTINHEFLHNTSSFLSLLHETKLTDNIPYQRPDYYEFLHIGSGNDSGRNFTAFCNYFAPKIKNYSGKDKNEFVQIARLLYGDAPANDIAQNLDNAAAFKAIAEKHKDAYPNITYNDIETCVTRFGTDFSINEKIHVIELVGMLFSEYKAKDMADDFMYGVSYDENQFAYLNTLWQNEPENLKYTIEHRMPYKTSPGNALRLINSVPEEHKGKICYAILNKTHNAETVIALAQTELLKYEQFTKVIEDSHKGFNWTEVQHMRSAVNTIYNRGYKDYMAPKEPDASVIAELSKIKTNQDKLIKAIRDIPSYGWGR